MPNREPIDISRLCLKTRLSFALVIPLAAPHPQHTSAMPAYISIDSMEHTE